jgi:hypothetical protein
MKHPYTEEELRLAREIAMTLGDLHSLQNHLKLVRKYSENHLRKILAIAMAYPDHKVRTSRARIYISLISRSGDYDDTRNF